MLLTVISSLFLGEVLKDIGFMTSPTKNTFQLSFSLVNGFGDIFKDSQGPVLKNAS